MASLLMPIVQCVSELGALTAAVQKDMAELSPARLLRSGPEILLRLELGLKKARELELEPVMTSNLGYEPIRLPSLEEKGGVFSIATKKAFVLGRVGMKPWGNVQDFRVELRIG